MRAHEDDLRVEVTRHLREQHPGLDQADAGARATTFARDVAAQGSEGAPEPRLRALLQYAERLALTPGQVDETHLLGLRELGLTDREIHDAVQVVAYFSYINRIADGLGVDLEPEMERR